LTRLNSFRFSKTLLFAGSALGLTAVPLPAAAEDVLSEDAGEPAPEIIVTAANRTETSLDKVGQSVSVVDLAEIERRQTQNVADILRTLPGVTIARNGSIGGNTSVFIRGAESDQTVALIDGVKLNDPSSPGGGFNFGNLLTGNIERIEVLRGSQSVLWVRASVFGSDMGDVRRADSATVRTLGDGGVPRAARPVQAPPSANTVAGTVDLYYALDNRDRAFRVGQRVAVDLPLSGQTEGLSVPSAAILRDIHGGEWVYQKTAPDTFVRQRVEVASESGGRALLARGLSAGAQVVTDGAAELFGTEFGAAH